MSRQVTRVLMIIWLLAVTAVHALEPPQLENEAPRIRALLEQAWSAESGQGYATDTQLALLLYCQAGLSGSPKGYYYVGRLLLRETGEMQKAYDFLALAAELGYEPAVTLLGDRVAHAPELDDCAEFEAVIDRHRFDLERYIAGLSKGKQAVASMIRQDAERFKVPERLAIAVACAESNLDSRAVSPKQAQGVMQLIPDTQKRFGVANPFDARQNVQGGLRYLKWLLARFDGNVSLALAAYNAGEGTVKRYGGVPPYPETRAYVKRVMYFAGMSAAAK